MTTFERLKELVEKEEVTRWEADYLARDHLDSGQYEGWRIHDLPDRPNPHGVWFANYVIGAIDEKDTAELICASVNLAKAIVSEEAVERMARAYEEDLLGVFSAKIEWSRDNVGPRRIAAMRAALEALLTPSKETDHGG